MNANELVTNEIVKIVKRKNATDLEVSPRHLLVDELGFGSLDIAELVAVLEMKLGFDPFAEGASIASVRTVADMISIYGKKAGGE